MLKLLEFGQSYWIDDLTRSMIKNGELKQRVEKQGLRGVTSNPSIFNKAITGSHDYDDQIYPLIQEGRSPTEIYEALVTTDVHDACTLLQPLYDKVSGQDGFISLEVSPHLAHDTQGSIKEARRLWQEVSRPNLLIKIPGTAEGIPAIEELLFEGISINVTLLFSVERYEAVAQAYLRALERRIESGRSVNNITSVASFFISRIDVLVDQLLDQRISHEKESALIAKLKSLQGKMAIANAKLAYQSFQSIIQSDRWKKLQAKGAQAQRMLWASTSTKNPNYRDVMYVEPLIGPHTINTMPEETIAAFADHGVAAETIEKDLEAAGRTIADLAQVGVDFKQVTAQLEKEGVQKFIDAYNTLLAGISNKKK
ncbi:transaldolase [Candidatus Nitrosoglobus terrae]|uniref:Transaldolase n=1 Tax=Candidatus Nitrosoglobus terrae TaxID=1630141 RepID=A0A1Q2SMI7_9GAMM|nr:transaldolase [Candidatus Nitrosoglobus terrae]BAW80344.1 transaldolase [Candidatus Nitrosoglobus terrae]